MREEDYQVSFEIIATAGDSKGYSMDAICDAREGKFDSANEKINEANKRLLKAHELQTDMIAQEAGGDPVPVPRRGLRGRPGGGRPVGGARARDGP